MNSIELTELHKSKLLEMCKNLFSENDLGWQLADNDIDLKIPMLCFELNIEDKVAEVKTIHWFEFCMTHLTTKISKQLHAILGHPTSDEFGRIDTWYTVWSKLNGGSFGMKQHPVDYLYEQFKKLKQ